MKFQASILCAAALSALAFAPLAQAQNARADVKADAAMSAASAPRGELSTPNQDKGSKPRASANSRAEVKAEAAAANKASGPAGVGQGSGTQGKKPMAAPASTESRAAVKAEAAAAVKEGKLPQGEASKKDQERGGAKP